MMNLRKTSRRIVKRHPTNVPVYLKTDEGLTACRTRNISRGGVFIETDVRGLRAGEMVELVFPFTQGSVTKLRRFTAIVIHQGFYGLGVRFCASPDRVARTA